jgi:4-diphosphocytidyl-2-C-methyl-D-erythritol kinase
VTPFAATEAAPAKVNLYLHVTGRKADGYHLLDSLVVFTQAADTVRYAPAEELSLVLDGPEGAALSAEPDNLVLRAACLLAAEAGVAPAGQLGLEKHLPVASGIGGGSADAAAALRLLARAWGLTLGAPRLEALAARLGADVPVCVAGHPARMEGVGEILSAAPRLPECGMVLANPRLPLPTPAVFKARRGASRRVRCYRRGGRTRLPWRRTFRPAATIWRQRRSASARPWQMCWRRCGRCRDACWRG